MATTEELLETLISVQEEIKGIEETQSSDLQTVTSEIQTLTSEIEIIKLQNLELSSGYVDETTPNYINQGLLDIFNSSGGYLKEETLANNEAYYIEVRSQTELLTFQLIIFGVFIAFFIVILVVKGFFKNVSN